MCVCAYVWLAVAHWICNADTFSENVEKLQINTVYVTHVLYICVRSGSNRSTIGTIKYRCMIERQLWTLLPQCHWIRSTKCYFHIKYFFFIFFRVLALFAIFSQVFLIMFKAHLSYRISVIYQATLYRQKSVFITILSGTWVLIWWVSLECETANLVVFKARKEKSDWLAKSKHLRVNYDIMCRFNESIRSAANVSFFSRFISFLQVRDVCAIRWSICGLKTSDCKWHEFPFQFAQ